MANVHMKLGRRASNARNNSTTSVVVVDYTIEYILIVVGIDTVAMFAVKMPWLAVGEMIVGMSSRKAQRRKKCWKNVKNYKHCRIHEQVKQNTRPN